ncbi:MAG: recombinase family protein [Bellilinea sp.]
MEKDKLRAVGYRRVSMKEQVDGHSLDAQEKNIRDYVKHNDWELIEIYTDAGISAKKDSHRPALAQLMKDAEAGKFDVVIVDKVDRFYRHLAGLLTALDELRGYNVSFVSVQERLDFTSPWGKLMLTVLGILAEIYLDNLRQETIKGKRQRAREGLWNGFSPFGYCRGLCAECQEPNGKGYCPEYNSPNKTNGKRLILHPIDSEVVKLVYEWYLQGDQSDSKIAERLNELELTLPSGYSIKVRQRGHPGYSEPGPFTRDYVRDMLKRIFYTGKLPYKSTKELGGRRTKRSEMREMEIFDGKHPVLISEEAFNKVQELRSLNGTNCKARGGAPVQSFPLTGLIFCSQCGNTFRGVSSYGRRYYRDASRIERTCDCPQESVRADDLELQLVAIIRDLSYNWQQSQQIYNQVQKEEDAERRLERAKELYIAGEISREVFQTEKNRHENTRKSLQNTNLGATMALAQELQGNLDAWDRTLPTERKKLLRRAVRSAFVRGDTFVALQPTEAFSPLVELKSGICGEGGIRTRGRDL